MNEPTVVRASGYRWVMLAAFMLAIAVNQLLWISFAPITGEAAAFYGVDDLAIGLLSLVFMVVFIVVSIPASWVIDTYGIRVGVGIGAVLTGAFGLLRGFLAADYAWVLAAQIGIAVGQPFVLNAIAKIAGRWFPIGERATATGLASLAIYVGIFAGLAATPIIVLGSSIPTALLVYGAIYYVLGFILFSAILAGVGSVCNTIKETQSLMMPVTLIFVIPLIAWPQLARDPNGDLARVLSYVPLTTPMLMVLRLSSSPDIWWGEIGLSILVLVVGVFVTIWAAGKVFRTGILMYGKRPGPREILRWLRER